MNYSSLILKTLNYQNLQCVICKSVTKELWKVIINGSKLRNKLLKARIVTQENERFSNVFRGYKMGTFTRNGLI